jgi:hypothetical protein
MDPDVGDLIAQLHALPMKAALVATGGGASAGGWLLTVPGGSRTVLEVAVPYAQQALAEYLAHDPDSYCSAPTARALALRARTRAAHLAPGESVVGLACTASLRSDRPKRGDHRVHVAAAAATGTVVYSVTLAKEQRDREGEEAVVARLIVNALAEAFAAPSRLALPLLPGEEVVREEQPAGLFAPFLAGEVPAVCLDPDGRLRSGGPPPGVLLSGSFNPLHEGHRGMALVAARLLGKPAAFELTVANADKPALEEGEIRKRMTQFAWQAPLWLTRAATFVEKARLFPGVTFVVGVDTATRIVQPRFYGGSAETMRASLDEIRRLGGSFLVACRVQDGVCVALEHLDLPVECRDLFAPIPVELFRADVSSTQLRAAEHVGKASPS